MPVLNRIADFSNEMTAWRHALHRRPELSFDCTETAAFVVARLREMGVDEIHEGIGQTGVVALIKGQGDGPVIGLRADMDALPIQERPDRPYKSEIPGKMHACGHDGHTSSLLGAAKYLTETRNFAGTVALIFQPAEEDGGGGDAMCRDGMMDRFDITQVYAWHNMPNEPELAFQGRAGALMASADEFRITVHGKGGHAAHPEESLDPIPIAAEILGRLALLKSRMTDPHLPLVVSVTQFHAGNTGNVIPDSAWIAGTVRALDPDQRKTVAAQIETLATNAAASWGAQADVDYEFGYPVTMNDQVKSDFALDVASTISDNVNRDVRPIMGAEDFSYMLEERPGAYVFIGAGDGAPVHHPDYDFNDALLPVAASWFAKLVETAQPIKGR